MPTAPLLQRFVDEELSRSAALVSRVLAGALQLLRESKESGLNASERGHCVELIAALQKQGDLYQNTFVDALQRLVGEELQGASRVDLPLGAPPGFDGLELMDESLVDVDIELSRAMQLIDTTAEWELRELQTFTSTLLGHAHVTADTNPFRPLTYANALWQAACAVVTSQIQRATLLQLSAGVAAGLLKNAWAAAATRLEAQGVEPGTYRTIVLPAGSSRAPSVDVTRPGALGGLLARMPGGSPGEGRMGDATSGADNVVDASDAEKHRARRAPSARGAEFEETLLRLEVALRQLPPIDPRLPPSLVEAAARLVHHRQGLVAGASAGGDRQVIELLSRLFEAVLSDPRLSPSFRPIVARLQVAALRVALDDATMLETAAHEVWQLLDRLGDASVAYAQPDDTRGLALQTCCQSTVEELARTPAPDATLFRRALNRIDAFMAEQFQTQLRAAQPATRTLDLAERRGLLEQRLSQRLADQMVSIHTTPGVRRFVTGNWSKVLAEAMLRFGEDAERTEAYLRTVDDLLWSLQVPDHPQSRQRLVSLLPVLLQRLRAGMELIDLPRADQQGLLDELMAIHAEALRPGSRHPAVAPTPEEIVQRMRDEIVTDVPGPRPFSDSLIDLSTMDTVPADVMASGGEPADEAGKRVENLRAAERVRLFIHGRWARCQLLWRSDQGQYFLFAGDNPARNHSITRRALERLSAAGLIAQVQPKPLLQRAVDQLMREFSTAAASDPRDPRVA